MYKLRPKKSWDKVKVNAYHKKVLLHISKVLQVIHSRKYSEWVKLVADVYYGQRLPDAVATSITKLQKVCEGKVTLPPESITSFDMYD